MSKPQGGGTRRTRRRRALALAILGAISGGVSTAALMAAAASGPHATFTTVAPGVTPAPGPVAASLASAGAARGTAAIPSTPGARRPGMGAEVAGARWVIDDAGRSVSAEHRALLRAVFGIDDVGRLFVPDSAPGDVLRYAARPAGCAPERRAAGEKVRGPAHRIPCRTVIVRVGLASPRRPGESWDAFVGRVARGGTRAWPAGARAYYIGLASLDPDARPAFERLVADARRAGFPVRVAETYRSPERQALLLARDDGRTATATSVHSYGRAVDLVVGDGRLDRVATVRTWIAFRRWVARRAGGAFRLVGTPERTWDWPHVELADAPLGFRSLDALIAAARACRATTSSMADAATRCTFAPHLPVHVTAPSAASMADALSATARPRAAAARATHGAPHRRPHRAIAHAAPPRPAPKHRSVEHRAARAR